MNVERKEAWDKVTGSAKYTADNYPANMLFARIVTSTIAHGKINIIDTSNASKIFGVLSIITGKDVAIYTGPLLEDRPILAIDKVRYYGEPIALVVAIDEATAEKACKEIKVTYEKLPVVNSVSDALKENPTLVHDDVLKYTAVVDDVKPIENSNIASSFKIRKGDNKKGFDESEYIVEKNFILKKSDHVAMETRVSDCEISGSGIVTITTCSQAPYTVKKLVAKLFNLEEGNVIVKVPLVGGAFGGKAPVFLELLAYIASRAVGGKLVRVLTTREQDFASAPGRLGMEATVKLGANKDGIFKAVQINYNIDSGAYTDITPNMAKAAAVDCTGPYNIENVVCDSLCVYTNHNYSTSFRGFVHESYTFCIERTIDELAKKLKIDPLDIRYKNAIRPGNFSPSQVEITESNTGDLTSCIEKLRTLINYDEGNVIKIDDNKVRAKGISCLWKTPNPPVNASSGAIITFNSDGSINLNVGVVEIGSGSQSTLCTMLAEKLRMDYSRIFVELEVNTKTMPEYWKTVASLSSYLAGRAVMNAADDLIKQLKANASIALRVPVEDLDYDNEKVFLKSNPKFCIGFQDLAYGVKYPDGNVVGTQVIGRGSYIVNHISTLSEDTGKGKVGHSWTVGAQAVEIEIDLNDYSYRLIKAATVMDVGKVLDSKLAVSSIQGGMSMGLSLASREEYIYDENGILLDTSLRNYKVLYIGQEPKYLVDFVETPEIDSPYGTRAFTEHGIIGMPAALGNALTLATNIQLDELPITPETIFRNTK